MDRVAALYRDHLRFVWNVLWRRHTPLEDRKDLAQDVFLVVMRKVREDPTRPGLDADEERAWLYMITIYQLSNHRARARFRKTDLFMDKQTPDPRNAAARLEDGEQLLSLLDSIKGQGRAIFELVELEGFTVVAAAKILEITESNAHKRLALARADVDAAAAKL
ncbi:MAG: sigma-70 family RNA polymerase sigma factor, partial [Byssovorax sp.]